jgi:hypothetical protein
LSWLVQQLTRPRLLLIWTRCLPASMAETRCKYMVPAAGWPLVIWLALGGTAGYSLSGSV